MPIGLHYIVSVILRTIFLARLETRLQRNHYQQPTTFLPRLAN